MSIKYLIANRELGAFPLSIGTSLAIEAFTVLPNDTATEFWFNIRTLVRNLTSSLTSDVRKQITAVDALPVLIQELEFLVEQISSASHGRCTAVFYYPSYADIQLLFPNALHRVPTTELQKVNAAVEESLSQYLVAHSPFPIRVVKTRIESPQHDVIVLTHYSVDLLWASKFKRLRLIESHTGTIKSNSEWTTKLTGGKDLLRIPFTKFTLQVYGDNNVLFSSMPFKVKAVVTELAEAKRWTTVTTDVLIESHLKTLSDPLTRDYLLKVLRS